MTTIQQMNAARLGPCLAKLIRYQGEVMTVEMYLIKFPTTRKQIYIQTHETRKRNLTYRQLDQPKTRYMIWHIEEGGRETGIEVAKLVFDSIEIKTETAEDRLRASWTQQGISLQRQEELISAIEHKASPEYLKNLFSDEGHEQAKRFALVAGEGAAQYTFEPATDEQLAMKL